MQREEIERIIAKYKKYGTSSIIDDQDSLGYDHFVDYISDNKYLYEEDYYETESDLWDDYNEANAEVDATWKSMFPNEDDDDAITDYVTR
jgi:hypothetical protein